MKSRSKKRGVKKPAVQTFAPSKEVPLAPELSPREQALAKQLAAQLERAERIQRDFDIFKEQRKPWTPGEMFGVAMAVSWGDIGQAVRLATWMGELEKSTGYDLLLSVPHDLPDDLVRSLESRLEKTWASVRVVPRPFPLSREHWPQGPNWSFACVSQWCHTQKWDFLLLEPDCVPLRPGWVKAIEREYRGCGRPYLGHHEPAGPDHQMHLAGVAVYQWETYQRLHWHEFHRAWDVAVGPTLVAESHKSVTIQQDWGKWNEPPTFPVQNTLAGIRPDAFLFHRNKDGTLIQRLREQLA